MKLSKLLKEDVPRSRTISRRAVINALKPIDANLAKVLAEFMDDFAPGSVDTMEMYALLYDVIQASYNKGTRDASSPGVARNGW